ncbi:MAG: GNAT family N-acetyltransferase [Christensenellaceae bacterium]|jgi:hypothetical protein|nr:GNAT family N-acetyltransferase [Christensenellaceae bacterium]
MTTEKITELCMQRGYISNEELLKDSSKDVTRCYITHNAKLSRNLLILHTITPKEKYPFSKQPCFRQECTIEIVEPSQLYPSTINPQDMGHLNYEMNFENRRAYVLDLSVDPQFQRNGLGSQMFKIMENHLVDQRVMDLNLFRDADTNCLIDKELENFYRGLGMEIDEPFLHPYNMYKDLKPEDGVPLEELGLTKIHRSREF